MCSVLALLQRAGGGRLSTHWTQLLKQQESSERKPTENVNGIKMLLIHLQKGDVKSLWCKLQEDTVNQIELTFQNSLSQEIQGKQDFSFVFTINDICKICED